MYIGGSCTAIVTAEEHSATLVAARHLLSCITCVESWARLLSADVRVCGLGQACKAVAMRPQHRGRAHHCYAGRLRGKRRSAGKSKFVGDMFACPPPPLAGRAGVLSGSLRRGRTAARTAHGQPMCENSPRTCMCRRLEMCWKWARESRFRSSGAPEALGFQAPPDASSSLAPRAHSTPLMRACIIRTIKTLGGVMVRSGADS